MINQKLTVERVIRFLQEGFENYNKYKSNNKWVSSTMTCSDVEYAWWDEEDGDGSWNRKSAMYQVRKQLKLVVESGHAEIVTIGSGCKGTIYRYVANKGENK